MRRLVCVVVAASVCVSASASAQGYVSGQEEWAEPYGSWGMGLSAGGALGLGAQELGASAAQGVVGVNAFAALGARTPGLGVQFPPGSGLFLFRDPFFAAALEIDGTMTLSAPGTSEEVALLQGRVGTEIAVGWVDGSYSEDYQRPVSFDDGYWRSEDGAIRRTLGVHVPGLLSSVEETAEGTYSMNMGRVQFERRELWQGSGVQVTPEDHIGDDYLWTVTAFEFSGPMAGLDVDLKAAAYDFERFVVPTGYVDANPLARIYEEGTVIAGRNSLDIMDIGLGAEGVSLTRLRGGFSSVAPASVSGLGEEDFRGSWSLGVGAGAGQPHVGSTAWNIEIGTFHRLDPTGTAVDAGHQAEVELAYGIMPGLVARGGVLGVNARRVLVSDLADTSTLPMRMNDIIYMGRAEASLSYDFSDDIWISMDGWAERSDRADVTVGARRRGIIPLQTVWGATLDLNIVLGSEREYARVRMQ